MIGTTHIEDTPATSPDGPRPVNLRTDLAPLADLIELAFADSMDSNGRAALREMRYLSKMGPGLRVLSRMNDMALGISMGYVWIADGHLVGNVSIYAANLPASMGTAWIIANVATHPNYQNRGIARRLMQACMRMIYQKGGKACILQVDINNAPARHVYRKLGFVEERAWTTWRRSGYQRTPPPMEHNLFIRRRRRPEIAEEMALAEEIRPAERGGIGWLRPLHRNYFRRTLAKRFSDWMNLRNMERLVVRDPVEDSLAASLWVENTLGGRTLLTLLPHPYAGPDYIEALFNNVVRRLGRQALTVEHPADDERVNALLRRYDFVQQRTVVHDHWIARPLD